MRNPKSARASAVLLETLRDARQSAGITQVQLARKLGKTQSFVSKIEQGQLRLDVMELRELCLALGTTLPSFIADFEQRLSKTRRKN